MKSLQWDGIWRFGANFIPSNAINQLEMWQGDTFDATTINRELSWAAAIGMRVMRVYLHDLLWIDDAAGFLKRMEIFLNIADKFNIKTVFVFFDDCWNETFYLGKQPDPKPYIHNSGWIQSSGTQVADDPTQFSRLEEYVKEVIGHFATDKRVLLWDLYNEPGNCVHGDHLSSSGFHGDGALLLLKAVFNWAREAGPNQPLTVGLWNFTSPFDNLNRFSLENSDVVSFHCYNPCGELFERINHLRYIADGRPLICTEYMARPQSTFKDCLPILQENDISAISWGLVSGKTNTVYPWRWEAEKNEPELYFHDVFKGDGSPLYPEEVNFFKSVIKSK